MLTKDHLSLAVFWHMFHQRFTHFVESTWSKKDQNSRVPCKELFLLLREQLLTVLSWLFPG